jgi:hypothetical protein
VSAAALIYDNNNDASGFVLANNTTQSKLLLFLHDEDLNAFPIPVHAKINESMSSVVQIR